MTKTNKDREASATIRGYIFQFDATINKILGSDCTSLCKVEGTEDFDLHLADLSLYFQCKYYAGKKLTGSVLRDAILPMIKNYIGLKLEERVNKRYFLYGYFKETNYSDDSITLEVIKSILVRKEKVKDNSEKESFRHINIQDEVGATDDDLKGFASQFSLELCSEYKEHKRIVIEKLASTLSVTQLEAEEYIYPSSLTLISRLASNKKIEDRTITKNDFLQKIKPKHAVYNAWLLREKNQKAYCKDMRLKYFSKRNVDPKARFFIIDVPEISSDVDVMQTLNRIRDKWSSHKFTRKPDEERYAPYIFLNKINQERLVKIKEDLHREGCCFCDGYPFQGARFCFSTINKQQTRNNKLSIRFLNSEDELRNCITSLKQPRSVYQFFIDKPLVIEEEIKQVCIPVTSPTMINDIV